MSDKKLKQQDAENEQEKLDQYFSNWLEGGLMHEKLSQHEPWQQRLHTANYVAHQADVSSEQNVPHWDRSATFISDKQPWWQWRGLPITSIVFSLFAIALVLFKVELVFQPQGLLLSFSGSVAANQEAKLASLVDQRLKEFASEQQVVLANYAADIKVKQQDNNLQLASYIISAARQERKEDMTEFIGYINEQRKDDEFAQKIKYQQIEQQLNFQRRYQNSANDGLGNTKKSLPATPATWTTEE